MIRLKKVSFSFLGSFILVLATFYFFYEFFLRVILGTIASEIMEDLNLGAEQFAFIGSAYYLTYSLMQTPVGILVDRFGVRLLVSVACVFCNIGVLGFILADGFTLALISRLLIGFGSSFAFVSILVLALNWFPREQFATIGGLIQFLGGIGPFLGGAPLAWALLISGNNWRFVLLCVLVFGVALNLFLALFVRTAPKGQPTEMIFLSKTESLGKRLIELMKNRQAWCTVAYAGTIYGTLPLLGAFWGTSYMKAKGFSRETAAFIISMIWVGLAIGSPALGKFSELIKRRRAPLLLAGLLGIVASSTILYFPIQSKWILSSLFFLIGFASSGQSVSFAIISEHVPRKLHATAIGLNNTSITFTGFLIPPIASFMIVAASPPGTKIFTEKAFEYGFTLIPVMYFIAFVIALIGIKETYCRQQHEVFPLDKSDF